MADGQRKECGGMMQDIVSCDHSNARPVNRDKTKWLCLCGARLDYNPADVIDVTDRAVARTTTHRMPVDGQDDLVQVVILNGPKAQVSWEAASTG